LADPLLFLSTFRRDKTERKSSFSFSLPGVGLRGDSLSFFRRIRFPVGREKTPPSACKWSLPAGPFPFFFLARDPRSFLQHREGFFLLLSDSDLHTLPFSSRAPSLRKARRDFFSPLRQRVPSVFSVKRWSMRSSLPPMKQSLLTDLIMNKDMFFLFLCGKRRDENAFPPTVLVK